MTDPSFTREADKSAGHAWIRESPMSTTPAFCGRDAILFMPLRSAFAESGMTGVDAICSSKWSHVGEVASDGDIIVTRIDNATQEIRT
jgi:uncharacterized membrane protein